MADNDELKPRPKGIYAWLLPALKSRRKWKTFIRCIAVLASTVILLVDEVTLRSMGQAGFFAAVLAIMLPPSLPLSVFILATLTLVIGMMLGWAWGTAAQAAALHARSQTLLAQRLQQAQASFVQGVSPQLQMRQMIFSGYFLDPRSSAVYGAFIFIGVFFLAAMRGALPSLALLSIFGMILVDVICVTGPLIYQQQYVTIPKQFLIPTGYYVGVAVASLVLIFPESLNHNWLATFVEGTLVPARQLLALQSKALDLLIGRKDLDRSRNAFTSLADEGVQLRRSMMEASKGLISQVGLADLECSIGRLGPGDLKRVSSDLRGLMFRAGGIIAFQNFMYEVNAVDLREAERKANDTNFDGTANLTRVEALRAHLRSREAEHGHDLSALAPLLAEASADVRAASEAAFDTTMEWFRDCNSGRWTGFLRAHGLLRSKKRKDGPSSEKSSETTDVLEMTSLTPEERLKVLQACLARLEDAMASFQSKGRAQLIEPYKKFFDPKTGKLLDTHKPPPGSRPTTRTGPQVFSTRSLFICFLFVDTHLVFSSAVSSLLKLAICLETKRPVSRFWAPSGFGKIGRKLTGQYNVDSPLSMGSDRNPASFGPLDPEDDGTSEADSLAQANKPRGGDETTPLPPLEAHSPRNPDALPPTTGWGRTGVRLGAVVKWFRSPEGVFALRSAVVSLALWIPAVCPSSAKLYYDKKGMWALIMGQTALAIYAGDQIAGLFFRLIATAAGLLLGMAAWYVGAGSGPGNPYGIVISTTVFIAPFLFLRIVAPPQDILTWAMTGITIVFVTGYSWIDSNLPQLSNPGVGYKLGWMRALLVVIGFTAGFIVMLFPRPTSARTHVRHTLAATLDEFGRLFGSEIEAILAEEARGRQGIVERPTFHRDDVDLDTVSPKERRVRQLGERALQVATRLQELAPSLVTGKWEPQVQGLWPQAKYVALHAAQSKLLSSLSLLVGAFIRLDTKWCTILVHKTPFVNPNLLADIFSTIAILSHALNGAHALPAGLPRLHERLIYHDRHSLTAAHSRGASTNSNAAEISLDELDPSPEKIDGASIGFDELSLDLLMDEQLPAHATAVIAISRIIGCLDDIAGIIRDLCGETSYEGISALHQEYVGREERGLYYRPGA
ncbi:hypothetical protein HGRIS_003489 [Hohenbuehelia grisea]|uniref:ER transporter 6TM N-terminal domain-containing protein n=1 Tax=Hohenbuehelia grisea TaxID=104357 RepID=A0ABR3JFS1_9AGAR